MIDFSNKTYENLLQEMLSRISDRYDKRDTSPIPTSLGPAAYAFEGFYLTLDQVQKTAFVQTAVGESLDYLAAIAGLTRYPASSAVRLGIFNTTVPIGSRFSTMNGTESINFIVTASTDVINQYHLSAETPGNIGNNYTGAILPITSIPGLTSAEITDILIPGDEIETDDDLRNRLIDALNEKPFGGNIASYRTNILAIDGVGAVQVYPTWNGGGTVKCSILGADFLPASSELIANVQKVIDPQANQGQGLGMAPIGATVTIIAPSSVTVNIDATISIASGYNIEQVKPVIENAINSYLLAIRKEWGTPMNDAGVEYATNIYISQITAAIIGVSGVVNVTNVLLNGSNSDLILTETGTIQQVPILGAVVING